MSRVRNTIIAFTVAATCMAVLPTEANADGPLRRWLRSLRGNRVTDNCGCETSPYSYAPATTQTANYAPNPYNLQPGQCMKTCQQTCSRTVVNYVPYTAYRTQYNRVPVTQYRPETKSDPCTGCTVTCMKPCTTYTYQVQRVPYTTYRPVYRQETYKVPVTTITNGCATGACGTCQTCDTGTCQTCVTGGAAGNYAPTGMNSVPHSTYTNGAPTPTTATRYEDVPNGTLSPSGSVYGSAPADQTPALPNPVTMQRPFLDRYNQGSPSEGLGYTVPAQSTVSREVPATISVQDRTAQSPTRKQWGYTPIRTASYSAPSTSRGQLAPIQYAQPKKSAGHLNGWKVIN